MARITHENIDVAIIGGGPASLILSYVLHGHIPYYIGKHHDALLDSKLQTLRDLLQIQPDVYSHFGSSLRYSQQAQPINALLDTLVRPNADTEIDPLSHIEWRYEPKRAISHVVLTDSSKAGGQWTQISKSKSDEIGALSYAEMLSLPGYSFKEHYREKFGSFPPDLIRPSRKLVASYFTAYPYAVGISDAIRTNNKVARVSRDAGGFLLEPLQLRCRQLVLATGIFTHQIAPPQSLLPLNDLNNRSLPLLVIGSGFSSADTIIATAADRKIVHIFKWNPSNHPSPLRGCHHQAYPEYAGVYRQMKAAAAQRSQVVSPLVRRKTNPFFKQRDWSTVYEGLPNATIESITRTDSAFKILLSFHDGTTIEREVGGLAYHIGRRGSLAYLNPSLLCEVLGKPSIHNNESENDNKYLRRGGTRNGGAAVAKDVYAVGSLTGDSLVRHAFGVCLDAASMIMAWKNQEPISPSRFTSSGDLSNGWSSECGAKEIIVDGKHESRPSSSHVNGWAHDDLHVDRRDLAPRQH